jgi:hypothetical protein
VAISLVSLVSLVAACIVLHNIYILSKDKCVNVIENGFGLVKRIWKNELRREKLQRGMN